MQECVWIYLEKRSKVALVLTLMPLLTPKRNIPECLYFRKPQLFNLKDRSTLQKVRISEQCRRKRWVGYAYDL